MVDRKLPDKAIDVIDESGASMVEYGVAVLVVAAIGVGTMTILGGTASTSVTAACATFGVAC